MNSGIMWELQSFSMLPQSLHMPFDFTDCLAIFVFPYLFFDSSEAVFEAFEVVCEVEAGGGGLDLDKCDGSAAGVAGAVEVARAVFVIFSEFFEREHVMRLVVALLAPQLYGAVPIALALVGERQPPGALWLRRL